MNWLNFLTQEDVPLFSEKTTLQEALDETVETHHKTGIFLEDGKVTGIITERDIIRSFISGIPSDKVALDYCARNVIAIRHNRSIEYALGIVISKNLKRAPVVDDNGTYIGLLTHDTLLNYFDIKNDGVKQKAINLIQGKSLITAKTTDSLAFAASLMYKNKIGLLPLTISNQVVGIISESDILRLIKRCISFDNEAGLYMNTNILFAEEDSYSDDILELMDDKKVSHVLVRGKNSEAVGALSKRDLIRNLKDNYQKILEKKLKNARDALSRLPNPIIELCKSDEVFYISWCNEKAEEAIGRSLFDLKITDAISDEKFISTLSLCALSKESHSCTILLNGRTYEVMFCKLDEFSIQLLFNDLTEVKKSEEYLRALIDFLPELIVVTNGKDMLLCNQSLLKFFGFNSFEEFKNKHKCICETFIAEPGYLKYDKQGSWLQETLKNMKNGVDSLAKIFDSKSGKELIFLVKGAAFMQNKNEFLITFFDITESIRKKIELETKNKELKELASIDSLTGIYNRNKLKEIAISEFRKYKKDKIGFSLIIFDIDYFKKINDTFGHNAGDYALKTIVKIVVGVINECDAFARWGGEEFVVLAPNTNTEAAFLLSEMIRKKIEEFIFEEIGCITCSFGVAEMVDGFDFEALIENADKALYMAKRSGRNRTEIYLT